MGKQCIQMIVSWEKIKRHMTIFFKNLLNVCSQVTTPLMFCMVVDCTPYHDWGAMVTVQWLDACIYRSLPLPAVHTSTTITVKLHGARLIIEDTVPPVPGVPHSVCSSAHMAASPVIHSPSGTLAGRLDWYPAARSLLHCSILTTSSEIGGSSPRTDEQLEWNDCPWPFESAVRLLGPWSDSSNFQAFTDVADQCLGCITKFCWRILATQHPSKSDRKRKMISQETQAILNRQSAWQTSP